jgi:NADH-quinone oxidoreductase subunit F
MPLLTGLKAGIFANPPPEFTPKLLATIRRLRREDVERPTFFVGTGTCGLGAGAGKTLEALKAFIAEEKLAADVVEVGCIGLCSEEPILEVQLPGRARVSFGNATEDRVPDLLRSVLAGAPSEADALGQHQAGSLAPWPGIPGLAEHPFLRPQKRWVLAGSGLLDPLSIDEYIARGGYSAMARTLTSWTPEAVCQAVLESGLRGRGGGGFPAGKKWQLARANPASQKYLICNADEGDPGAFMDRAVGESDPHRLVEGMIIAAYAIGATKAYIYIRAEYPLAVKNLHIAIDQAREYGLLGHDLLGTGFDLDIVIKMGAGAFVCGEETALIHSIEGKRGMPRPRPPFPAQKGLFDKPTIINNVETLANLPALMSMGAKAFAAVGTAGSKGTKVFALSGNVNRTGLVEVPMGTPLRQVVFAVGGGIPNGKKCKAVQLGGPSGGTIPEANLDVPTDYEALKATGAIMGSGGLVVLDENTCVVDLAKFFMEFIQKESCGKCIPCREGTKRMLEILESLTHNRRSETEQDALLRFQGVMGLEALAETIRSTSLCGLGQTAPNPVLSTLRAFRSEYEAHIFERRCPAGSCKELVGAPCQTGCPVGTEVWRYAAHIARGEYEDAYRVIRSANPFPSACARVCNHPCENACRAGTTGGEALAVRTLKRFVVDRVDPSAFKTVVRPARPDAARVAVIGAGPSGLTAAHMLSLRGHRVTLLERDRLPGGMLRAGIPAYRLPREVLDREIEALLNENLELRTGVSLGVDFTVDGLLAEGYKAVYLSLGSHRSKRLGISGEDSEGVVPGIRFLRAWNLDGETLARGRVGVVGGGNSAIDAARVAIRQPGVSSVTIYYRRSEAEMPAHQEEIDAAREEGIKIETLVTPVGISAPGGRLAAATMQRQELGPRDESGRRRPVPIPGSEREVPLDYLVIAISEEPEVQTLGDALRTTKRGTLEINPESRLTSKPGVFAGGDMVTGPNTVIDSIAAGKKAAEMIDRYLTGKQLRMLPRVALPTVYVEPVESGEEEGGVVPRVASPHMPAVERKGNFAEVELSVTEAAAVCEARRCLRCDLDFTRPL